MNQKNSNIEYFYTYEWQNLYYKGVNIYKYPADIITYQEIIFDTRPEVIIESGTCTGASSLLFYDTMVSCGIKNPLIITIDIDPSIKVTPNIPNIVCLQGSSLDPEIYAKVKKYINNRSVMVSLDADHIEAHVLAELNQYHPLVTKGNYLVVEDTFLGEYGEFTTSEEERFLKNTGKTPKEGISNFLKTNNNFIIDTSRNKYISMNPNGYLKRR